MASHYLPKMNAVFVFAPYLALNYSTKIDFRDRHSTDGENVQIFYNKN